MLNHSELSMIRKGRRPEHVRPDGELDDELLPWCSLGLAGALA